MSKNAGWIPTKLKVQLLKEQKAVEECSHRFQIVEATLESLMDLYPDWSFEVFNVESPGLSFPTTEDKQWQWRFEAKLFPFLISIPLNIGKRNHHNDDCVARVFLRYAYTSDNKSNWRHGHEHEFVQAEIGRVETNNYGQPWLRVMDPTVDNGFVHFREVVAAAVAIGLPRFPEWEGIVDPNSWTVV